MKRKAAAVKKKKHTHTHRESANNRGENSAHSGIRNTEELHKIWRNEWQQQQQVIIIVRDNKILIFFLSTTTTTLSFAVFCLLHVDSRAHCRYHHFTLCVVCSHTRSLPLANFIFFARSFTAAFFPIQRPFVRSLTRSLASLCALICCVYILFFFIMYTCNYRVVKQAIDLEKAQTHCHT